MGDCEEAKHHGKEHIRDSTGLLKPWPGKDRKGRGREGEREGGRKGRVEIKDQEEALARTNLGPVLQRKCSETQAQRMYCEALGKWGVRLHGQAVGPGPDAGC